MNDHGETMQTIVGTMFIFCVLVGVLTVAVCARHLIEAVHEWFMTRNS